ncbi:hypothetical protein GIB67_007561 [Kingdonia uniflora]|uniref:HMG box domain-containing protein n=1 Tax=Kingdonia uniflora TaxID=39325 RepID=A0A7J7LNJ0_9MAGN|nr:hypothetical protein GIB67_007561 [Kingdonia uniflora]
MKLLEEEQKQKTAMELLEQYFQFKQEADQQTKKKKKTNVSYKKTEHLQTQENNGTHYYVCVRTSVSMMGLLVSSFEETPSFYQSQGGQELILPKSGGARAAFYKGQMEFYFILPLEIKAPKFSGWAAAHPELYLDPPLDLREALSAENKNMLEVKDPIAFLLMLLHFFSSYADLVPRTACQITKISGEKWKNMSEEQRLPYEEKTKENRQKKMKQKEEKNADPNKPKKLVSSFFLFGLVKITYKLG